MNFPSNLPMDKAISGICVSQVSFYFNGVCYRRSRIKVYIYEHYSTTIVRSKQLLPFGNYLVLDHTPLNPSTLYIWKYQSGFIIICSYIIRIVSCIRPVDKVVVSEYSFTVKCSCLDLGGDR